MLLSNKHFTKVDPENFSAHALPPPASLAMRKQHARGL